VLYWHQVRIRSRCRDNKLQIYWGHDLDLSGSRDVISHVTIRISMGHFLLEVYWKLEPSLYLHPLSRYWALSIWGSRPNWLQANCPDFFTKDQWPPNSPDVNAVEYCVWGAMLEAYRKLKTKLKTIALQVIWGNLPHGPIDKAVKRLLKVIHYLCWKWRWTLRTFTVTVEFWHLMIS